MALQVCSRCRKRRIKCDLQLPACKNCSLADVECTFWDHYLRQEISSSHLHHLRQKKRRLELEIEQATDRNNYRDPSTGAKSHETQEQGYHLNVADGDNLNWPSQLAYLGPGSSAHLLNHLLKNGIYYSPQNGTPIPDRLLSARTSQVDELARSRHVLTFPTTSDLRKAELHSLVTPSTQRAMIEHYMKVVSQEYPLLHLDGDSAMLTHENPLRWSAAKKDSPDALEINVVFAISSALITRDLDPTMSNFSSRCIEDLQRFVTKPEHHQGSLDTTWSSCTALCGLALCDMIRPSSGQLWDLLGRAWTMLEDLRDQYQSSGTAVDQAFQNLEHTLLKMESMTAIHFRRYSAFCAMYARSAFGTLLAPNPSLESLSVLISLRKAVSRMDHSFQQSGDLLENLIPSPLQVRALPSTVSIDSARLYIALHPLFTASEAFSQPNAGAFPSRLFHVVGNSACTIINHYALLNEENNIICLWMAAEQVLEAGLVWAVYIMNQRQSTPTAFGGSQPMLQLSPSFVMDPIIKVSTLLASLTARWRNGSAYAQAWEIFVQMFWGMAF